MLTAPAPAPITPTNPAARAADFRSALRLTYATLAWMTIEGAGSVGLGLWSRSLLLTAFGIDSAIELFSAVVLLWRLRAEVGIGDPSVSPGITIDPGDRPHDPQPPTLPNREPTARGPRCPGEIATPAALTDPAKFQAIEFQASRLAGFALLALAIYIATTSIYGLIAHHASDPQQSIWGIAIGVVAAAGMPILARAKLKLAGPQRLNSKALRADAMESLTCGYLSWVLIAGLAVTRLLGWWWLDSAAALVLVPFLVKEGRAALTGGCHCGNDGCADE